MIKDKIAKIIYDELCYMYCDNCRYCLEIGEDELSSGCDDCHRKYNGWGISMAKANKLAEMAIEVLADRPTGEWKQISPAKIYECSECRQNVMTNDIEAYKFCHNCGARMNKMRADDEYGQ